MMKKILIASLIIVFPLFVQATNYETVITSGQGQTLDQAINVGLRRAVEQVAGVSIDSGRISTTINASNGENDQVSEAMIDGMALHSKGDVKYRILSEQCLDDVCTVKLEVKAKADPRDKIKDLNSNRRAIAVEFFTGPKGSTIGKKVQEFLVQDRKFKVLHNKSDPALQYLVTGKVLAAKTNKRVVDKSRTIELTGEKIKDVKTYYDSKVLVEFRILDVVNNQVKWSATIPTTSSRNNLNLLVDIASKKIFKQLKDNIYPLLVLVGESGSLVLNSGGNTVKQGQYFDVFNLGEKFIDPVTKESLGRDEIKVAIVKVTRVLPKVSYLKVVKGDASKIKNHSIARKLANSLSKERPNRRKMRVPDSEPKKEEKSTGIILPF